MGRPTRGVIKGRSLGKLARWSGKELRQRAESQVQERIDSRDRRDVYRMDAEHTGDEKPPPLPPKGPERDVFAAEVRKLKEAGVSHVQAGIDLGGYDMGQISQICKDYGIPSQRKRQDWRKGDE